MFNLTSDENTSAIEARSHAQYIAFAPFIFQATAAIKELNILSCIDSSRKKGLTVTEISKQCNISTYGVKVLLDFCISIGIFKQKDDKYFVTKTGYFLQNDEMTQVNFEFNQHFCYDGLSQLSQAIITGKPEGLKVFGQWETLYPALTSLPEKTKTSWFNFDHYYSDNAFDEALNIVFSTTTKKLIDIGGNTGKWTLKCLNHDEHVQLVIMDLKQQLAVATKNVTAAGFQSRFTPFPCNMLDPQQAMYKGGDTYWMSQFLDCFSPEEIKTILTKTVSIMQPEQRLFIMETFIDRQQYEAASFSLNATSLYFTCFANGNSRMYSAQSLIELIEESGLVVKREYDNVGLGHTLLECYPKNTVVDI